MSNPVISETIKLLNDHPEEWDIGEYTATNSRRRVRIWIANSLYGLSVNGYGGVTMASSLFGWLIPWRVRIWRAVWRARAAQLRAVPA